MKSIKKVISIFLAILTLFSICSASTTVFAAEYTEQKARTEYFDSALSGYLKNIVDIEDAVSIAEKEQIDETIEEVQSSAVSMASTFSLRTASVQNVEETESVQDAVEDLDIDHTRLTLELEDGENVAYLFSEPVSFIDDEGNLVYKDTNINAVTDTVILNRGYSYENGDNDYKAYFSEDSSKGLLLIEKDGEEIRLVPNGTHSVGTVGQIESDMELVDSFEYAGVYGTDSVLRFLPQLNSCKEEIVLYSYQGISDFSFTLYTEEGTISALNSNGEVEIIDSATKDIITTFVAPFANDSSGGMDVTSEHYTDCTYELEMISEGKYTLTICVPEEYLESESTVYPVIIDPTTGNVMVTNDSAVYSAKSTTGHGGNPTACFGKTTTSQYGKGRAMFFFKVPEDIENYATISSAKLWLRETTGRTETMYVRPYLNSEAWASTVTWDTQPAHRSTFSYPGKDDLTLTRRNINSKSTDNADYPYWYAFNITNAVRAWTTGTANKGLKFIAECEASDGDYLWRAFATKEHTTSSYRPYAVISYTNDTTAPSFTVSGNPTEWTKDNVTLTVTATDNVYGVNGISGYSFDNGESWQTSKTKTFSKNQTVYIKVKDKAGNISAATTVKITKIDKTAPTISKVALSTTSWTNGNVKVTVTASDSASGLASKAYSFDNGSTWQANNYKSYSANNSSINVKVRDTLGNVSTYESNPVKITKIDKTVPSATITISPTTFTNGSVTATIKMTDNAALASYTLDGASAVTISGTSKTITKTYSKNQTISLAVKDAAGNSYTTTKDITNIDKTKPSVTITLSSTSWTNGSVTATIKMTDNVGLKSYSLDGATAASISGTSKTITKTYTANDTIDITVTDTAGNSVTASKSFTNIDKTNPSATITLSPTSWTNGSVTATIKMTDNAALASYTLDGASAVTISGTSKTITKTYSANETISLTVKDAAGNTYTTSKSITNIDKTNPCATISLSPTSATNENVTATIKITDNAALASYTLDDASAVTISGTSKTITKTYSKNHTISLTVKDAAGNSYTTTKDITNIDKTKPSVTITLSSTSWTNGSVTATIKMTDNVGLKSYSLDGTAAVSISGTSKTITKTYTANDTIDITVTDTAGNSVTDSKSFTNIDKTNPSATITLSPTSWTNGSVTATIKMTDNAALASYTLDGASTVTISGTSQTIAKTYYANETISLTVKDAAGNTYTTSKSITNIDKTKPSAIITLTPDTWTKGDVTATIQMTDNAALASYTLDGASAVTISGTSKTITKTYSKNQTISVTVKDQAGNSYSEEKKITNIDKSAPVVTVLSETTSVSSKITVNASDAGAGLHETAYCYNDGDWTSDNFLYVTDNSEVTIKVRDILGNIYTTTHTPEEKPEINVSVEPQCWTRDDATITVNGTGLTKYSFDNGESWQNGNVLSVSENGNIIINVTDVFGNTMYVGDYEIDVIDKLTPEIIDVNVSEITWTYKPVTVTVTAIDEDSGIYEYSFDGGESWQTENVKTFNKNEDEIYPETVLVMVKDTAGNTTQWDEISLVPVDVEVPSTPDLYEQDGLVYISSRSFDFNEDTDSAEYVEYSLDGTNWSSYEEPLNIVRTYGAKVYARVRDDAENISPIAEITLENTLGEYTASYTDIALGEGLFPVEFGRTYTSTNGWFFTFDANIDEIDENAYVFTDFYGEKHYFIKNSEGKYLSVDEEELTIVESTDEETGNKIKNYRLNYGDMIVELGNNCKLSRITTDYTTTEYKWNADGSLTIDGGAVVNFDKNFRPTSIVITRKENKDGVITDKTKTVVFTWENDKLMKFTDAMNGEHAYGYDEETGLLITNDTETISYSNGRVKLISQTNKSFVKYTYNDTAASTNTKTPKNIGSVTVSDSKGVTDTIPYSDGVYVSSSLDSYSDKAVYAPGEISAGITTDAISNIVYVVESEPQSEEEGTGEPSTGGEPESDGEPATDNDIGEETNGVEPDTDGDALTDNEAGDTDDGTENGTESGEDNNASSETETPLYEEIDEDTYAFYTYDNQKRVTAELEVLKANITIVENTTFKDAEAVAESKITYVYFGDDSKKIAEEEYYSKVGDEYKPTDKYTYTYTEAGILSTEKYAEADVNYNLCLNYIFTYDKDENIVLEQYFRQETENETTVDVEYENFTRVYEGENLLSETQQTLVDGVLTATKKLSYEYDIGDQLTSYTVEEYTLGALRAVSKESYNYNSFGNIAKETVTETSYYFDSDANDVVGNDITTISEYNYDIWNQQINITVKKTGESDSTTVITYDDLGNISTVTEDGVTVSYEYSNGNVIKVTETKELQQDDETKVTKTVTSVYEYSNGSLVSRTNTTKVDGDITETTVASYGYDKYGNLTYHEFNGYAFTYNTLGSILTAKAAVREENGNKTSVDIVSYTYSPDVKQDVLNSSFGNNQIIDYDYNADGEITAIKLNTVAKYEYKYSSEAQTETEGEDTLTANLDGEWVKINDKVSGLFKVIQENKTSVYDSNEAFVYSVETSSKDADNADSFDGTITTIGDNVYTLVAEENEDVFKTNNNVDFRKKYVYNEEKSELERTLTSNVFYTDYGYGDNGVTVLENVFEKNDNGEITEGYIFNYGYQNENISSETLTVESKAEDGSSDGHTESVSYEYDDNDQLTKATSSTTEWAYEYDSRGNIISKTIKDISTDNTVTYTYGYDSEWQDRLISYNGESISYEKYDDNGELIASDPSNPLIYRGNELTWTMGRQLASFGDISYTYNEDGIRTSKTANNVRTTFLLDGYNVIEQTDGTTALHFFYDSNGEVIGFRYNGNDYFYVKNAMNDIIAITDNNKNIVAEYRYDPWGKVQGEDNLTAIGALNPFRYRSYYYDSDIKMYYLQSRYYDAEVGRFINGDDVSYIGLSGTETGYNPFVYCENNAMNNSDPLGNISLSYFPRTWITKLLLSVVGYEVTHRKEIHSIEGLGIRIALTQVATYTANPKAFFTKSKSSITASLGGLSFSLSGLKLSATADFSYKGVSVSSFVGVSKTYIEFGMLVSQYVQGRYKKCSFGIEMAIRVKKTVIKAMAVTIVAANLLLPQLTPVFAKGAIVVSNLVTVAKINAKTLLTPMLYVAYKAFS